MKIVYTESERCKRCYACIRSCPVRAIRVTEGKARVMKERCIACGTCVRVCAQGAKQYERSTGAVWEMLGKYPSLIAVLDPSCPAAFEGVDPGQLVSSLGKLGFSQVMEGAFGAELIFGQYKRLMSQGEGKPIIASYCPVIVCYVEMYHPKLIGYLAPVVSPMIAMGRTIKGNYDPSAKVVYIGPCIAKKAEISDGQVAGAIDAVLTFSELREMLAAKGIDPSGEERKPFSGPKPRLGRLFPLAGSFLKASGISDNLLTNEFVVTEGKGYISGSLREFARGHIRPKFIDLRLCHGCIDGPAMDDQLSIFKQWDLIIDYAESEADPAQTEKDIAQYADIDLTRKFTDRYVGLAAPSEEEIINVLRQVNKAKPEERLDCGACGYATCHELAAAVCQDLAEIEMCWPFLVQQLETTQSELIQAEKLTSLGQMAASIAHEINNPLAGVLVYTQLLTKKVAGNALDKEVALEYLAKMDSEIGRSSRIIRNLLDFARQSEPSLRPMIINHALEKALSIVHHQAELQNIEVIKELNPSLPNAMADFDQLQQVFTNLILNAIQAMPDGGRLTLRTSVASDGQLKIDIQDTGCGISKENLRKLFTPFFTTKEKGKGVGLGLAVVHGIIQRHKGRVEAQSEVGKGTTFTIYLGAYDEEKGQNP